MAQIPPNISIMDGMAEWMRVRRGEGERKLQAGFPSKNFCFVNDPQLNSKKDECKKLILMDFPLC